MSKDVLNYTLAASAAILTFFMAWILYYVVSMIRDVRKIMYDMTHVLEKINNILDYTKEKVANAATLIPLIVKTVEKGVDFMKNRKAASSARSKRSEKSQDEDL